MPHSETDVLIVGGGPVGLTLALDLSARNVRVTLIEALEYGENTTVRCNHVSSRSMEVFRRLGLAKAIRSVGLPGDYRQSASYRISATGEEIAEIRIAPANDRFTERDNGEDAKWPTPEPPHRVNQVFVEPILANAVKGSDLVTTHYKTRVIGIRQDGAGVTVEAESVDGDGGIEIRAAYVVGCDGGSSFTRKSIGAKLEGDAVIQRCQSTYIRAPKLIGQMKESPAWAMFSMNANRVGNIYSIDGVEKWLVHNYLKDDEADFDSVDRDRCIRDILGVDEDFEYEILANEDWFGRRLVTTKMQEGRVFIAGDAAHLWVPYGGYGMNAGIADAVNLGWKLSAVLHGWADPRLLDAYEKERHPITEQVSRLAMDHCAKMAKQRSSVPDNIAEDSEAGRTARKRLGEEAYRLNVQQYQAAGLNFGYYYDQSPVIEYDGEKQPDYSMGSFEVSSVPGCRAPHVWLQGGHSLWDALGDGYTLLRLSADVDVSAFEDLAAARNVDLKVLDIDPKFDTKKEYKTALVLVRSDQHVAWRGDAIDAAFASALLDRITGCAA